MPASERVMPHAPCRERVAHAERLHHLWISSLHDHGTDDAHMRMLVEGLLERAERVGCDTCVAVQEKDAIGAAPHRFSDPLVAPGREAVVLRRLIRHVSVSFSRSVATEPSPEALSTTIVAAMGEAQPPPFARPEWFRTRFGNQHDGDAARSIIGPASRAWLQRRSMPHHRRWLHVRADIRVGDIAVLVRKYSFSR